MTTFTESDYQAMEARTSAARRKSRGERFAEAVTSALTGLAEDEAKLQDEISDHCRSQGWLALHGSMAHRAYRTLGEPDFIICTPGRVLFVECKTRTGKLRPEQLAIQAHLNKLGHDYHIVRSLEEFITISKGGAKT